MPDAAEADAPHAGGRPTWRETLQKYSFEVDDGCTELLDLVALRHGEGAASLLVINSGRGESEESQIWRERDRERAAERKEYVNINI